MDSDGEMEVDTIPRMIAAMAGSNVALVIGSRWLPGGGFVGYSPPKRWLNWSFQQLFRILFRTRLHDLTYGFKLMRAELIRNIAWEATLHEIGCETTLKPIRLGVPGRGGTHDLEGPGGRTFLEQLPAELPLCRHGIIDPDDAGLKDLPRARPVKTDLARDCDQLPQQSGSSAAQVLAGQTAERDLE